MSEPSNSSNFKPDELFARARAGDQAAWEELFRTCYPKVIRVVRRKLDKPMRSLYDSTDFASDVWKSLAAKADRFDFPSIDSLLAFLKQVAEQKVIDEYRRLHTLKHDITLERPLEVDHGNGPEPRPLPSGDPTPSQVMQEREGLEQLLARSSGPERELIHLKRLGHTNEEIASHIGWNVRRVQRFLKILHEKWRTSGGDA